MAKKRRPPPIFIGIDLAWSPHNPTGAVVLRGHRLLAWCGSLGDDGQILRFVEDHLSPTGPAIVAIDAPLRVPNETGTRACDRELSADWHPFQAGAYPANRRRLALDGTVRGEGLVAALVQRLRFAEVAPIPRETKSRVVCEVYPHPATVALFGLERTLKYKARSGRTMAQRSEELGRYQRLLRNLRKADPPLKGTKKLLTGIDVCQLRGRAYKEYEDILDALTCAYVASYLWTHGPQRAQVYGGIRHGHILVPVPDGMVQRLEEAKRRT
jgi:predicted RNase H-like nuclease